MPLFAARQGLRRSCHFAGARRCAVLSCLPYTFGGYCVGPPADVLWQIETNLKTLKRMGRNWNTLDSLDKLQQIDTWFSYNESSCEQ